MTEAQPPVDLAILRTDQAPYHARQVVGEDTYLLGVWPAQDEQPGHVMSVHYRAATTDQADVPTQRHHEDILALAELAKDSPLHRALGRLGYRGFTTGDAHETRAVVEYPSVARFNAAYGPRERTIRLRHQARPVPSSGSTRIYVLAARKGGYIDVNPEPFAQAHTLVARASIWGLLAPEVAARLSDIAKQIQSSHIRGLADSFFAQVDAAITPHHTSPLTDALIGAVAAAYDSPKHKLEGATPATRPLATELATLLKPPDYRKIDPINGPRDIGLGRRFAPLAANYVVSLGDAANQKS